MILELKGWIRENGELEVILPQDFPVGEVAVKLTFGSDQISENEFQNDIRAEQKRLLDKLAKQ